MTDAIEEEILGTAALIVSFAGTVVGQVDTSIGGVFVSVVTQFGGLGLAVWLVYQHTTRTIPDLQREHREEREIAIKEFKSELDLKRAEYLESLKALTESYQAELQIRRNEFRDEFKGALNTLGCKVGSGSSDAQR